MAVNQDKYQEIINELGEKVKLVAVSKLKSVDEIKELYQLGQRDFGENYVQELLDKQPQLPPDTRWHFIGHLQSNKVKYIVPFIELIQGVDSLKLLNEIDKQGKKINRVIKVLLQVHIAREETKFGLSSEELDEIIVQMKNELPNQSRFKNTVISGLMGMASNVDEEAKLIDEFRRLKELFDRYANIDLPNWNLETLSMGMSSDYKIAVKEGSNMVRIGSLLFGARAVKN